MLRDIFICHSSADKSSIVRPLRDAIVHAGMTVWYDEDEIHWGDSLSRVIQEGLATARLVLVILTPNFSAAPRGWRDEELHSALAGQISSEDTKVLPLVVDLAHAEISRRWPFIAGRRYARLEDGNLDDVVKGLKMRVRSRSQPLLVDLAELDRERGTFEERLALVEQEIWISGNDNMFVAKSKSSFVLKALARGVRLRLLSVDPESAAAEMLALTDPRFPTAQFFRSESKSVELAVRDWYQQYPTNLEFRYLPILPAMGFFITDPGLASETVKLEIYTAKPWSPLDSRPHLLLTKEMPHWRAYFKNQFENYWNLSRSPW